MHKHINIGNEIAFLIVSSGDECSNHCKKYIISLQC
jgi:hypothetical protein